MSNADSNQRLNAIIENAKKGNRVMARVDLETLLPTISNQSAAWIWQAWLSDSPAATMASLERALEIDPDNEIALSGLIWAESLNDWTTSNQTPQETATPADAEIQPSGEATRQDSEAARSEIPDDAVSPANDFACELRSDVVIAQVEESQPDESGPEQVDSESEANATPIDQATQEVILAEAETSEVSGEISNDTDTECDSVEAEGVELSESELASAEELESGEVGIADAECGVDESQPCGEEEIETTDGAVDAAISIPEVAAEAFQQEDEVREIESIEVGPSEADPTEGVEEQLLEEVQSLVEEQRPQEPASQPALNSEVASETEASEETTLAEPESNTDVEIENIVDDTETTQERPMVLAVDDSPTVRKLVAMTLERVGYEVVVAADGVAALNLLAERLPVLILSDINMPRITGYKLCKLVKKHQRTSHIPVVMLSGKNGVFDKVRGQMVGCADYITKPFESHDLIDKVRRYALVSANSVRA